MNRSRAARLALMALASVCFALKFGLNFGKSNQSQYLLPTVRALHPELWPRDWMAHTRDYHPVYGELAAVLLRLDPSGWTLALSNVVAVCVGVWCVYRLLRLLLSEPDAFVAFMIVLSLAAASSTDSVGGSYVFADIFQPSTLGSVGLLGASLSFVAGRRLLAGVCLAFAGAFHLNYLLLGLCVFGGAWLASGKERRWLDALYLLGPSLPVLVAFLPILMASRGAVGDGPGMTEEARRLLQDVRAPHHYRVLTFVRDFVPWAGFQLLGVAALWSSAAKGGVHERRLLGLLAGFFVLIACATLLSSVGGMRAVDQLFAWRISPHAELLAELGLAAFVVHALGDAGFAARELGRPGRVLFGLGVGCLVLAAALGTSRAAALLGLLFLLLAVAPPRLRSLPLLTHVFGNCRSVLVCVTFFFASLGGLRHLSRNSDLLAGRDPDVDALCGWLQHGTSNQALLLIPPGEEDIRFRCQRSVVVDWKSTPGVPSEIIEWGKRVEDVTGKHPLRGEADVAGYEQLDRARLEKLRERYGFDTLIVHDTASLSLATAPEFSHGRFRAYRLKPALP